MLLAGCCTTGGNFCKRSLPSDVCATGTISGYTLTGIAYGDSSLIVVPISHIRRDTEWRFRLQPIKLDSDYEDYKDAIVTIEGKPAEGTQPANHYLPRRKTRITIHEDELIRADNPLRKERKLPMPDAGDPTLDETTSW